MFLSELHQYLISPPANQYCGMYWPMYFTGNYFPFRKHVKNKCSKSTSYIIFLEIAHSAVQRRKQHVHWKGHQSIISRTILCKYLIHYESFPFPCGYQNIDQRNSFTDHSIMLSVRKVEVGKPRSIARNSGVAGLKIYQYRLVIISGLEILFSLMYFWKVAMILCTVCMASYSFQDLLLHYQNEDRLR